MWCYIQCLDENNPPFIVEVAIENMVFPPVEIRLHKFR